MFYFLISPCKHLFIVILVFYFEDEFLYVDTNNHVHVLLMQIHYHFKGVLCMVHEWDNSLQRICCQFSLIMAKITHSTTNLDFTF